MKELRWDSSSKTLPDRMALAAKNDLPLEDFLLGFVLRRSQQAAGASASRRAHQAGLDPDAVFERWDKSAKVTFDRRVLNELFASSKPAETSPSSVPLELARP